MGIDKFNCLKMTFFVHPRSKGSDFSIHYAQIIHLSGAFYVIGDYSGSHVSTIGRFDLTTRKWTKAGDLVTGRAGHNIIYDGNYLLVIGGYPGNNEPVMSEKCSITNGQVTCTSQPPELTNYSYYPELYLVQTGYCKEMP